jgi:hypothetical protein
MFTRTRAQEVRHSTGYVVGVLDRTTVHYSDPTCVARISVDFGPRAAIYADTLSVESTGPPGTVSSGPDEADITIRIQRGLEAMGVSCDVVNASASRKEQDRQEPPE